jgi:hypothetical protein
MAASGARGDGGGEGKGAADPRKRISKEGILAATWKCLCNTIDMYFGFRTARCADQPVS